MFTPTIIFYEGGGGWWRPLLSILLNSISIFCRDLHVSLGRSVTNGDALAADKKLYFGTNFMLGAASARHPASVTSEKYWWKQFEFGVSQYIL